MLTVDILNLMIQIKSLELINEQHTELLTFTTPRMLDSVVESQQTHFLFKETPIIKRRSVGGTYGLLVGWAVFCVHAAGIVWSKSLTKTVVITGYVQTRIQI